MLAAATSSTIATTIVNAPASRFGNQAPRTGRTGSCTESVGYTTSRGSYCGSGCGRRGVILPALRADDRARLLDAMPGRRRPITTPGHKWDGMSPRCANVIQTCTGFHGSDTPRNPGGVTPDDGVGHVGAAEQADVDRLAEDLRIGREPARPQVMADHHCPSRIRHVVVGGATARGRTAASRRAPSK